MSTRWRIYSVNHDLTAIVQTRNFLPPLANYSREMPLLARAGASPYLHAVIFVVASNFSRAGINATEFNDWQVRSSFRPHYETGNGGKK